MVRRIAMYKDESKIDRETIIEKPGMLAAKIIYNQMFDNGFNLSFIGNVMGNTLYTVQLNNEEKAIVGFTDENLLQAYVNRMRIAKTLRNVFGGKIVCVTMNICTLHNLISTSSGVDSLLNPYHQSEEKEMRTVVVNPNDKDFFIPLHIHVLAEKLLEDGVIDDDGVGVADQDHIKPMEYDKEEQRFFFKEENSSL